MAMHDAAVGAGTRSSRISIRVPPSSIAGIKTVIGLPNFPSLYLGTLDVLGRRAAVLSHLFPASTAEFDAMKEEPRSPGSMAASTIGPTSKSARSTASGSAAIPSHFARQDGAE